MIQKEGIWGRHNKSREDGEKKGRQSDNIGREENRRRQPDNRRRQESEQKRRQSALSLTSNSLSQTDREYFNIVKTEDDLSQFIKHNSDSKEGIKEDTKGPEEEHKSSMNPKLRISPIASIPHFLYHKVYTDSTRPVLGLYLGSVGQD